MPKSTIRVGVIGAGLRAASYFTNLPEALHKRVQLVALADPNPRHRTAFYEKYASILSDEGTPRYYDRGIDLLENEELDALVIGSPNNAHAADACPAFERKIPTLLEKPVAVSVEECRQMWQSWQAAGEPPVTVGFVLRTTPFYDRIRQLVQSGQLGQLLTLDADENIGTGTTRQMRSGWRSWAQNCGGFMIEKCSHDFDLLRWISGSEAKSVFSFAARTHFVPGNPQAEPRFDQQAPREEKLDYGDAATRRLFTEDNSGSLYTDSGDLPDHQSVIIEWENGVTTCFTATFAQLRPTRRMRAAGTSGNVEGDAERSRLLLDTETVGAVSTEEIEIPHDSTGHHGGDGNTAAQFWNSAFGVPVDAEQPAAAGLREGIEAVLIGIAAQQSAQSGQAVDVSALRRQVFGN